MLSEETKEKLGEIFQRVSENSTSNMEKMREAACDLVEGLQLMNAKYGSEGGFKLTAEEKITQQENSIVIRATPWDVVPVIEVKWNTIDVHGGAFGTCNYPVNAEGIDKILSEVASLVAVDASNKKFKAASKKSSPGPQ